MSTVEMFDSASDQIPADATDILVYTDGAFANAQQMAKLHPNARLHTISAVGQVAARWIDVEPNCVWPPSTAVSLFHLWWREQGCKGFYCATGTKLEIIQALIDQKIDVPVEWFEADPTGVRHVIAGDVATQWRWAGAYDESTLEIPDPPPAEDDHMPYVLRHNTTPFECVLVDCRAATYIPDGADLTDLGAAGVKTVNVETVLFKAHCANLGVTLPG